MKKVLIIALLLASCGGGGGSSEKQLEWVPGETPTAGVFLRQVILDDQRLILEVVGNGLTDLYGLAFRLQYDPEILDFTRMIPAIEWPANAISIAQQDSAGILVAAITNRGTAAGLDFSDQVLATLRFTLLNKGNSCINFIELRCALVDTTGTEIPGQTWIGGMLELR